MFAISLKGLDITYISYPEKKNYRIRIDCEWESHELHMAYLPK